MKSWRLSVKSNDYLDNSNKSIIKRQNVFTKLSVYCPHCGHTVLMINVDRTICTHCGYWVYKDKKSEFKYKMMENLKKCGK